MSRKMLFNIYPRKFSVLANFAQPVAMKPIQGILHVILGLLLSHYSFLFYTIYLKSFIFILCQSKQKTSWASLIYCQILCLLIKL